MIEGAATAGEHGFHSWWIPQIFGFDALAVLAMIGREVPGIALGTAVVATYPRHPVTMAQQALTAQAASGGRLTLGVGLSHRLVVENVFGLDYDRPAHHMAEYLGVLMPLLGERAVSYTGDTVSSLVRLTMPTDIDTPEVVVAALGPRMLELAGRVADGTVTWMTGPKTLADHIVPSITRAATDAGRPGPRVVACLPVCVTDDADAARARCAKVFRDYGSLPSYRAMLDMEGVQGPADVAIVGSEDVVRAAIDDLGASGVTEFVGVEIVPPGTDPARTRDLLRSLL